MTSGLGKEAEKWIKKNWMRLHDSYSRPFFFNCWLLWWSRNNFAATALPFLFSIDFKIILWNRVTNFLTSCVANCNFYTLLKITSYSCTYSELSHIYQILYHYHIPCSVFITCQIWISHSCLYHVFYLINSPPFSIYHTIHAVWKPRSLIICLL